MTKQYQRKTAPASEAQPAVPEQVSVALGEIAGELREGLLALAVGTGLCQGSWTGSRVDQAAAVAAAR